MTRCGLVVALLLVASQAHAHESRPGVLGLEELPEGRFLVAWSAPVDTRLPDGGNVRPRYPAHCTLQGAVLDCGARGLEGEIAFDGLAGTGLRVAVVVTFVDAPAFEGMADADAPRVTIEASGSGLGRWVALGMEHVLLGIDHLAFLLGLLFVSSLDRRLVVTITAFTLAHSLTLALAVLDVVRPSPPLVEALIALSVLLVAREGLRPPEEASSVRRAPWGVAAFFGLVHGLGLAGALRETSLPQGSLVSALFGFNVGVELGQLAFVGAALLVARLVRGQAWTPRARTVLVYAVGIAAAYWLVLRTAAIVA